MYMIICTVMIFNETTGSVKSNFFMKPSCKVAMDAYVNVPGHMTMHMKQTTLFSKARRHMNINLA